MSIPADDIEGFDDFEDAMQPPAPEGRKSGRAGNRKAGVETYQNMLRILFVLRDALEVNFPGMAPVRVLTAKQIAKALAKQDSPPSAATIRKYLVQLENQTPSQVQVVHNTPGREIYWRLKEGSPLNREGLSDFEAAMVCLASELLEPVLPPHLQNHLRITRERAEEMLVNARPIGAMPADSPVWMLKLVNRIWIEPPPPVSPEVLEAVFEAVRSHKRLVIEYQSMEGKREGKVPAMITVSPLRLVQHGDSRLYLIASDIEAADNLGSHQSDLAGYRRFALHRVRSATMLQQSVERRPEIERLIDSRPGFGWQGKLRLVAMVSTDIALRLGESMINETQRITYTAGEKWHRLEVDIESNWELRWWILSNGENMVILEPPALRDEIAGHFRTGHAQYQSLPGKPGNKP